MRVEIGSWHGQASEKAQCELLYALIRCLRPGIIVEAGTYMGHGAAYMAKACKDNGVGKVYTADIDNHGVKSVMERNELTDWCEWHVDGFVNMIDKLPSVDFAYIDSHATTRLEHFMLARAKLSQGGVIAVDDTGGPWDKAPGDCEEIRSLSTVNFRFLRGLSLYYR